MPDKKFPAGIKTGHPIYLSLFANRLFTKPGHKVKFLYPMITGAHSIIYSSDPDADLDFFKNILKFPNVDLGHGWLIFGLPPSEIAVHPAAESGLQELYLMCDDINLFVEEMAGHKITCSAIEDQRWGFLTYITLPGGGKLGVYEPKHARPPVNS